MRRETLGRFSAENHEISVYLGRYALYFTDGIASLDSKQRKAAQVRFGWNKRLETPNSSFDVLLAFLDMQQGDS